MKYFKSLLFCTCVILLASCHNNVGDDTITEYAGISSYYIINQSKLDLITKYEIKRSNRDHSVIIPANSTIKIFEAGQLGSFPPPSVAFANLSFYKRSEGTATPILTIKTIENKNWKRSKGNNSTKWKLTVTNKDLQ